MKSIQRFTAFFVLTIFLGGCASNFLLLEKQAIGLHQDMPASEVEILFDKATLGLVFDFEVSGKQYSAKQYSLKTGEYKEGSVVCIPNCITIPVTNYYSSPFFTVFEAQSQKLVAWGTMENIGYSLKDSFIAIAPTLKEAYEAALKNKKAKK